MVNINLSKDGKSGESGRLPLVGGAFWISFGLLVFTVVVYGALLSYNGFVTSQMAGQRSSVTDLSTQINSPSAQAVTDFFRRSEEVQKHIGTIVIPSDTFGRLEKTVLPSVMVSSYQRDGKTGTIDLTFQTATLKDVAQQILSFKGSFDNVIGGSISIGNDGLFTGTVTMTDKASS